MNREKQCQGRRWAALLLTVLALAEVTPWALAAPVAFTKESGGDPETVYVAGNPDLYPIEYYNKQSGRYEGILPELLEQISGDTGVGFTYVMAGKENQQAHLAKNRQVEMLTAYVPSAETDALVGRETVFTVELDGRETEVCIAFTDIADRQAVETVETAIRALDADTVAGAAVRYIRSDTQLKRSPIIIWVLGGLLAALTLTVVLLALRLRHRGKDQAVERLTDTTGIGNQAYFRQRYGQLISRENRELYYVAYIAFDIGWANAYLGREKTDRLLSATAGVLEQCGAEITARVAGGAFALAFQSDSLQAARNRVEALLERMNGREEVTEKAVFRAGLWPLSIGNGECGEALEGAWQAYLWAVERRERCVAASDPARGERQQEDVHARMREALEKREFVPYLQCVIGTDTDRIYGVEMLSRWQTPRNGLLTPDKYIGVMEKVGLLDELDYYMFDCACRQLEQWGEPPYRECHLSCNLTRITLSQQDFLPRLREIAARYDFDHSRLIVEVTEDTLEENKETARQNVLGCREMGFRIAIDDFGSGYTAFTSLYEYPVDYIKMDRDIVSQALGSEKGLLMMKSLIAMAHAMGMKVICEGVESDEQDCAVRDCGCDLIQGWRYARAIPANEIPRFFERYYQDR